MRTSSGQGDIKRKSKLATTKIASNNYYFTCFDAVFSIKDILKWLSKDIVLRANLNMQGLLVFKAQERNSVTRRKTRQDASLKRDTTVSGLCVKTSY